MTTILNLLLLTTLPSLLTAGSEKIPSRLNPPSLYAVTQPLPISQQSNLFNSNQSSQPSSSYASSSSESESTLTPPSCYYLKSSASPSLNNFIQSNYEPSKRESSLQLKTSQERRAKMKRDEQLFREAIKTEQDARLAQIAQEQTRRQHIISSNEHVAPYSSSAPTIHRVPLSSPFRQNTQRQTRRSIQSTTTTQATPEAPKKSYSAPNSLEIRAKSSNKESVAARSKALLKETADSIKETIAWLKAQEAADRKACTRSRELASLKLNRSNSLDDLRNKVPQLTSHFIEYFKLMKNPLSLEHQATSYPNGIQQHLDHLGYTITIHVSVKKNPAPKNDA